MNAAGNGPVVHGGEQTPPTRTEDTLERQRASQRPALVVGIQAAMDTWRVSNDPAEVHGQTMAERVADAVLAAGYRRVQDPTVTPDPRRWGRVIRGPSTGERVYWDASLHARRENAWTNVDRTKRFSADMVLADRGGS